MLLSLLENEKRRFILKGGAEDGGSRCCDNVVTPMRSVSSSTSIHYALISPKAELKVQVFLRAGQVNALITRSHNLILINTN